jgi:hypothetical protein
MTIHLEHLSLEELVELNKRVVQRIHELHGRKTQKELEPFKVGDRVSFQSDGRMVEGLVVRVNRKTLSVRTGETSWILHPRFVTKLPDQDTISPPCGESASASRWN